MRSSHLTTDSKKRGEGYRSNEWLTYVSDSPNGTCYRKITMIRFAGRFARDDGTFPDGYDHLDESQARVWHEKVVPWVPQSAHDVPTPWEHRKSWTSFIHRARARHPISIHCLRCAWRTTRIVRRNWRWTRYRCVSWLSRVGTPHTSRARMCKTQRNHK